MKKSKMVVLIAVATFILIAAVPMSISKAGNSTVSTKTTGPSLIGVFLTAGVNNISEDVASIKTNVESGFDKTPETGDRTPVYIVSAIAMISFMFMTAMGIREFLS